MMLRRLIREPLVHFLAAGLVLFGLHAAYLRWDHTASGHRVKLTQAQIQNLQRMWAAQWNRMPDRAETDQLIEDDIREEILYREAIALGLDQGDTIVRRRLAMKMDLLLSDPAAEPSGAESDLRRFYAADQARYAEPARLSFTHIYFSADKRKHPEQDALGMLRGPVGTGDPFPYGADYESKDAQEIDRDFGPGFARKILGCRTGVWEGPFESGFGYHLVLVRKRSEQEAVEFQQVREQVNSDYREQFKAKSAPGCIRSRAA